MIPDAALDLICEFEGFSSAPYACPAGVPTIGYGTTRYPDGTRVTMDDRTIHESRGRNCLRHECGRIARVVDRLIVVELEEHERAALISFAYNIGTGALAASALRSKLNRKDRSGAAAEFPRWRFAGGRMLPGLIRRRAAERALFEGLPECRILETWAFRSAVGAMVAAWPVCSSGSAQTRQSRRSPRKAGPHSRVEKRSPR